MAGLPDIGVDRIGGGVQRAGRRRRSGIAGRAWLLGAAWLAVATAAACTASGNATHAPPEVVRTIGHARPGPEVRRTPLRVASPDQAGSRAVVLLTPLVEPSRPLPVLYLLHGLPGRPDDLCDDEVAARLSRAVARGAPPFLIACPDGSMPGDPDTEWADTADGRARLETFVTGPLISAVEGDAPRGRGERAIGGFSMGGYAAAALALRHPDLYGQVIALSGYFHVDDPDGAFTPDDAPAHDPDRLVSRAAGQRWFLADGDRDGEPVAQGETQRFTAVLRDAGVTVFSRISRGGHTPGWARAQLPAAFSVLASGWR